MTGMGGLVHRKAVAMGTSLARRVATRLAPVAFAVWWLLAATAFGQGNYTRITTSGNWDTTTADWAGAGPTWVNGGSSNAIFNTNTDSIALTEAITAGAFTFGLTNANTAGAFTGASLAIQGDLTAQADANNSAGGPTLSFANNVTVGGDVRLSRRVLEITGGTFTANRLLSVDSWGRLLVSGGAVTMTNGIDDSVAAGGNTLNVFLQGGSLYTPYIKTTSAGFTGLPDDGVVLNGGTLYATANSNDFIQTWDPGWGVRNTVGVGTGGATINTNGFDITITKSMVNYGGAGVLTKAGAGTLRIGGGSSYSGGTTVSGGTLEFPDGDWFTGQPWNGSGARGGIVISGGATLSTSAGVTQFQNGVTLNGGMLSSRGLTYPTEWRNIVLSSDVSAGGAAASTIASAMNLDGTRTFTVDNGSSLTVTGELASWYSNGGGLAKAGNGTLVLSAANSYTGNTTVSAGTLVNQNTYATAAFAVASGAAVEFDVASGARDSATTTFSGGGTLRKTGAGELRWGSSTATFALSAGALIDVQAGTFVAGSNANENWSSNESDLNVASGAEFNTVEANVRVNAITGTGTIRTGYDSAAGYQNLTVGVSNGSSTFSGVIADAIARGNMVKAGTGEVTLLGANTYSGQTDITAGTLVAANNTALGVGGHDGNTMSFIRDGATLALQGGVSLDEHFHVWGSGVGGVGAVRSISGNNALTNSPSGNAGFALRSNTTVGVDADTLTVSGFYEADGNWGLTKVGAGTLVLTAVSSYTDGTTVNAGTLRLPASGGFGRIRGALMVNAGATVETTGDGTGLGFQDQISSVAINGGTVTSAGTMHVWNIAGGVSMTGGTLQSNGGVSNSSGSQLEWNRTSVTTNASGSTATIGGRIQMRADGGYSGISFTVAEGAAATDLLVSAAITEASGGMGVTKDGTGTMVLSGSNTYSGPTTVNDGSLVVNGVLGATIVSVASAATLGGSGTIGGPVNILAGGILAPGTSPGTLTVANTLALDGASLLNFEINAADTTLGSGINDLITGVTNLTLGGTLNLSGTGDFTAVTQGTSWRLINYSGTLTDNTLTIGTAPTLSAGLSFTVDTSTANQVNLAVVPEPTSLLLTGLGLAAAGWLRRCRR